MNEDRDQRWLLKPRGGSGGVNVRWVDLTELESVNFEKFFVQRFIEGRVYGATCFGDGKRSWAVGICQSIAHSENGHPFCYGGSIGPVDIESRVIASLNRIADRYVQQSQCRGMFNIDFVLDSAQQLWLLEINDRMGASTELIEAATGVSLVDRAIRLRHGESIPWEDITLKNRPALCKRILYADHDRRFDLAEIQRRHPSAIRICDLPAHHTLVKSGAPMCTIIEPFQKESSFLEPNGPK
jgi:predicted ATP-grasp superfamily ATP-dependent carboligase